MIHDSNKRIVRLRSLHSSSFRSSNFPHSAMHHFVSSAASSSSGRAERPPSVSSSSNSAEQPATSLRNAEQPEQPATPSHLNILSIRDVQRWLADGPISSCNSADAQHIIQAIAVLSRPNPRKENAQPRQSKWQLAQKRDKKPRPLGDVLKELQGKVIQAAQKLQQQLSDNAGRPV